jgi:Mg/Co/Ni transporter MgtE
VFEELDDDRQSRLLRDRGDDDIADVLARMRADAAADAIADLPQPRRQPVLDLLPAGQRTKVTALLGYNATSAGGLMGLDYLALPRKHPRRRRAGAGPRCSHPPTRGTDYHLQPRRAGRLHGAASLVALVQADPGARLRDVADTDPVRVHPDADLIDVTLLMTDYNLLNLAVVDDGDQLLGVVTVDDVLESTVPRNWRRREPAPHPDTPEHDHAQTTPSDPPAPARSPAP